VRAENEQDEDTQRREKQVPRAPHDLAAGGRARNASVCGRHSRDRAGGGAAASGRLGFVLPPSPVRSRPEVAAPTGPVRLTRNLLGQTETLPAFLARDARESAPDHVEVDGGEERAS